MFRNVSLKRVHGMVFQCHEVPFFSHVIKFKIGINRGVMILNKPSAIFFVLDSCVDRPYRSLVEPAGEHLERLRIVISEVDSILGTLQTGFLHLSLEESTAFTQMILMDAVLFMLWSDEHIYDRPSEGSV